MLPSGLLAVLGVAAFFLAALTVLPGVALKLVALGRRLRGRPAESPAVLGPLFWHELVRVTRRGTQARLRTLYALFLLVSLLIAYLNEFHEVNPIRLIFGPGEEFPRERVTAFAETFFHVFLFCQLVALTVVTPVFAGGSITEEKDRGTLAFLQASLLSNREIVLGKLAARVVFVLGLALTGLPVLAMTLLFGGVDPDILVTSFVAAVMSTVSLAAFSFWQATRHDTLKGVLVSAYTWSWALIVLAGCCGCGLETFTDGRVNYANASGLSPLSLLLATVREAGRGRVDLADLALVGVIAHGLLAALFSLLAMGNVRAILIGQPKVDEPKVVPPPKPHWQEVDPDTDKPFGATPQRERTPLRYIHVPYIQEDDPLLWKETYFGGKLPSFETDMAKGCFLALFVAVTIPTFFGILGRAVSTDEPQEILNPVFRYGSIGLLAVLVPLAGVRAVGCVSRERQRQTLDSLFTLPADRREFLRAKWRAAFDWLKPWLVGYAVYAATVFATGAVHPVGFLLTLAAVAAAVPFFLTLAVWLSVRCQTVVRATAWFLGTTFAAFLLPPMVAVLVRGLVEVLGVAGGWYDLSTTALSLPFAVEIGAVATPWRSPLPDAVLGAAASAGLVCCVFAVLTFALWRNAVARFEAEGR
jgi:ABC-type transport system involved in multi-copper enzyme maturation permease subunit